MYDHPIDLAARPSLEWLRKTARQLLAELRAATPEARLADAQLNVARRHGFASWRRLVAFVVAIGDEGDRLRAAVRGGDVAAVTAILDAEPELVHAAEDLHERERPSDEPGMSLLHLAVAEGQLPMARLLVARGAPLDVRNRGGRTALHDCFELGRDDLGRLLITAGATVDVCAAAAFGEHARLRAILRDDPASANDMSTGLTPLGWAGYACDTEAAEILIAGGAIVDRAPYDLGAWNPPCMTAAVPILRVLLAHGADPNVQDRDGDTPLHFVLASRIVKDPTEAVRVLLAGGADPQRKNRAGRSPLDAALARVGEGAETYFPKRPLGEKRLDEAIRLMREAAAPR